jgi:hypothetical protein
MNDGPSCQLEGLFEIIAGDVPGCALSGDMRDAIYLCCQDL